MEIKNEYSVTRQLCRTWLWENMRKPPMLVILIMWILIGLLVLWGMFYTPFTGLFAILELFCLYRAFFRNLLFSRRQYNTLAQTYGENWLRTICFEEDKLVVTEGDVSVSSLQLPYSDIVSIKEEGNKVWLILKTKKVIRLYKDKFVSASWEECRSFLEEKISS